ncbi:MAG: biotin--[acetyl-CoA-carboxylase] ligase [Cyclobacteriaceae bacterium]|nr:biotin--[acetyl-CoA-carboxylase] ligase [Cyclobacteriaceae bacterium]
MYKIPANLGFASNLVHYLPTCHSTNEIAANMLANGLEEGSVVLTDFQSAGKGQPGNRWESKPYVNLTFSLVLKPSFLDLNKQFKLTQAISISVATVVQNHISEIVKIKWPNDIYIGYGKVAGILIQNSVKNRAIESCIVGIGLNVNQQEFETKGAVSMRTSTGSSFDLNEILVEIIKEIAENYTLLKAGRFLDLDNEYQNSLYARNQTELFESDSQFYGEIIGTDQLGRLLIKTSEGIKHFQNQEVRLIRS